MWGEVLHLKPRLHRCCVYFELECRILISSSLWENISDNWREIGCIQNLPCPRQLSWMPELQNFACFGVSISGLHNIVLNMNTCHFRRLYIFFLSVAFRLKGWKTSPETNTAVDWSLEKCLPCLWVDDDGKNLQYILSFKLIVFWHHECSVFFLIFLIINWITDIYSRKRKFTRAKDNSKPPLLPLPTFSFSSLILNHHISCTIVEA